MKVQMTQPEFTVLKCVDETAGQQDAGNYIILHYGEVMGKGLHTYQALLSPHEEFGTWKENRDTLILVPQRYLMKESPSDFREARDGNKRRFVRTGKYAYEVTNESTLNTWVIITPSDNPLIISRNRETGAIESISK